MVSATVANAMTSARSKVVDFMPDDPVERYHRKRQTPEEIRENMMAAFSGRIKKRGTEN
jgi:hypothetical protein